MYRILMRKRMRSKSIRQLVNYWVETKHIPQSAKQIAAGVRRSAFYTKHGMNSGVLSKPKLIRFRDQGVVCEDQFLEKRPVKRALQIPFMDPKSIFVTEATVGIDIHCQLRAKIQWLHVGDDEARGHCPSDAE